jgi:hypothetical protein
VAIRETLNRHAWVATAGAAAVLALAAFFVLRGASNKSVTAATGAVGLSFYTIDDGATWFADRTELIPPFKKDGKDAVRAYVYRGSDGHEFVSHLERYTPEAKHALATLDKLTPEERAMEDPSSLAGGMEGIEVKRPKDKTWIRAGDPRGQQIMKPRSPDGKTDGLRLVAPQ